MLLLWVFKDLSSCNHSQQTQIQIIHVQDPYNKTQQRKDTTAMTEIETTGYKEKRQFCLVSAVMGTPSALSYGYHSAYIFTTNLDVKIYTLQTTHTP